MLFRDHHSAPALVLLEARSCPLWSRSAVRLLEQVEARLENVFVTSASMGERGPTVGDAVAAARFMGSSSAVIAVLETETLSRQGGVIEHEVTTPMPITTIRCTADPESIAAAYQAVVCGLAATA